MDRTDKIEALHPDPGKSGANISKAKYGLIRETILDVIREQATIKFQALTAEVEQRLAGRFEGSIPLARRHGQAGPGSERRDRAHPR